MDTSVIVPAWNEEGELSRFLEYLEDVKPVDETEIIFIAGGDDSTYSICAAWDAPQFATVSCHQQTPNDGYAGAIRRGLQAATGTKVIILDADTLVPPDWLVAISSALESADAVSCDYEPRGDFWLADAFVTVEKQMKLGSGNMELYGGGTIAMWRTVVDEIGLDSLLAETLVDRHITETLTDGGYTINRIHDTTVRTAYETTTWEMVANFTDWRRRQYLQTTASPSDPSTLLDVGKSVAICIAPWALLIGVALFIIDGKRGGRRLFAGGMLLEGGAVSGIFGRHMIQDIRTAQQWEDVQPADAFGYVIARYLYHFARIRAWIQLL